MNTKFREMGRQRLMFAATLALLLGGFVMIGNTPRVSADVAVTIQNFAFMPSPLTVPVGTTVTWTNGDSAPHTTTSDSGAWDSGMLATGKSFSRTFNTAGTFAYHCTIHPNMHGSIVVTDAAAQPAAPAGPPPQGGTYADPAFQQLWAATDANPGGHTYVWGQAPFTPGILEDYKEAASGQRVVQYFDKGRMELTVPGGPVTAGLLTVELITGREQIGDATFAQRQPARVTVAGDLDNPFPTYADLARVQAAEPDNTGSAAQVAKLSNPDRTFGIYAPAMSDPLAKTASYDGPTKHNVPKAFADFRMAPTFGGIGAIGLAITEPIWVNVKVAGKTVPVLIQGFERRVLTYTPGNPEGFKVEYGNIGIAYYTWRYQSAATQTNSPTSSAGTSPQMPAGSGTMPMPQAQGPQPGYSGGYRYP